MPRGPALTEYEKGQIGALRAEDISYREIGRRLNRSEHAIRHYCTDPDAYSINRHNAGRKPVLSERDRRNILLEASNSKTSCEQIRHNLNLDVNRTTIWRAIDASPYIQHQHKQTTKQLKADHNENRLAFSKDNMDRNWNLDLDCSDSIDLANHADDFDKDDDRIECKRDKTASTSMSTTDTLLAAVTAASSSIRSPHNRMRHSRDPSITTASTNSNRNVLTAHNTSISSGCLNLDSGLVTESQQRASVGLRPPLGRKQPLMIKRNEVNNLKKSEASCSSSPSPNLVGGTNATSTITVSQSKNMEAGQEEKDANKFKFFGNYVESALLDLHQQAPSIARLLVQSIYHTIADHQSQLTD